MSSSSPTRPARHGWVDIAKGICILAVVGLYTRNELAHAIGSAGWLDPWSAFAKPFRMPDFFLLSGLFLSQVIQRPWRHYLDTKLVHYVYFLALWISLIYAYDLGFLGLPPAGEGAAVIAREWVRAFIYPEHMLWFIQVLPMYFIVTRVMLRWLPAWLLWTAAAVAMASQHKIGFHPVDNFNQYYIFFLTGHLLAPRIFALADLAIRHRRLSWALLLAWAVLNQLGVSLGLTKLPGLDLVFGFLGISAIISLAALVQDVPWLHWLRRAGAQSIVIYLGFFIPLTLFIHAVMASGWQPPPDVFATLAVVVGAGTPMLFQIATRRTPLRYLFERPAWAHLVPPASRRRAAADAAAPAAPLNRQTEPT